VPPTWTITHDVLHREQAALPVEGVGFGCVRCGAAEDAAVDALQPAVIDILAGKEAADLMAVQPGGIHKETWRDGIECFL